MKNKITEELVRENIKKNLYMRKFVIYPYGRWGKFAEKILIENGIENYYLLDGSFTYNDGKKINFDYAKKLDDYYCLLVSERTDIYREVRMEIGEIFEKDRILDICYLNSIYEKFKYDNSEPRLATLESISREIYDNKIAGDVAEAGVYRGDFAQYINELFPDRMFWLFDSFEGFSERDVSFDENNNYTRVGKYWEDTNVEFVIDRMPIKEKIIIRKGFFPETAKDINASQQFCFVNLDMDLYHPIYEGLKFFYPRLSKGGYIFVHDCRSLWYTGAREALKKFCEEQNIGYVMLSDFVGTAVITK